MPVIPTLERWRQEGQRSALTLYLVSRPDCQKKGEGERWGGGMRRKGEKEGGSREEKKEGERRKRERERRGKVLNIHYCLW